METNNNKYLDYHFILTRVVAITRHLGVNITEVDIAEWCAECEIDYIKQIEYWVPFNRIPIQVIDGMAKLPCNVYRLRDVYYGGQRIAYHNDGSFLRFGEDFTAAYVFLNYTGIPIGEDGIPLILKGHEQACEAFCLWKLVYPLYIAGKYDRYLYKDIEDRLDIQCIAAKNGYRHKDRAEVDKWTVVMGNLIPMIGSMQLYHEAFADNGVGSINGAFWGNNV